VLAHPELAWLLSSVTSWGDLNRMHQFKEKTGNLRELASAGLFSYPVLMAADVLAYRATHVPVGDDQRQHIELMRDVAERFNARYGETLVVPQGTYPAVGARIMDLQEPTRKMSTTAGTEQGRVYVLDDPKAIVRKFKRAVTDSDDPPVIRAGADKPGVTNLLEILAAARGLTIAQAEAMLADARGYSDLKPETANAGIELLDPVRERAAIAAAILAALERYDVLIAPTTLDVAPRRDDPSDIRTKLLTCVVPLTQAPVPIVAIPLPGPGLPVGAQLVGRPGTDEALLDLAGRLLS
jgi:tryptophanyl-tRNA synthetase